MNEFLRNYPLTVACAIGGAAIANWGFDSWWAILGGLVLGAVVGAALDSKKK